MHFLCIIAYLLGSLSGGIIISRLAGGPDLHTVGSKSTGASNVQRTMGWKYGILTFLFDAVKGLLSCLIAWLVTGSHFTSLLAGLCCVVGHNWPVFFRFRGGKGVATTGAVMLYCFPLYALICIALTVAVIVSPSSPSVRAVSWLMSSQSKNTGRSSFDAGQSASSVSKNSASSTASSGVTAWEKK